VFFFFDSITGFSRFTLFYHEHTNKQKTGLGMVIGGTSNFFLACIICICVFFFENSPEFIRGAGFNNNYIPF